MSGIEGDFLAGLASSDTTFDKAVKMHKAVEYLIQNDAVVRAVAMQMETAASGILAATMHAKYLSKRIEEAAKMMSVSDEERLEGYPLPKNDAERDERRRQRLHVMETIKGYSQPRY